MLHGREGHCMVLTCIDFDTIEVILRDWRDFVDSKLELNLHNIALFFMYDV